MSRCSPGQVLDKNGGGTDYRVFSQTYFGDKPSLGKFVREDLMGSRHGVG